MPEPKMCPLQPNDRRYNSHDQWGVPIKSNQPCSGKDCALWRTASGLGWCGLAGKPADGTVEANVEPFDLYKLALMGGKLKLAEGIEIKAPEPPPDVLAKLIVALRSSANK